MKLNMLIALIFIALTTSAFSDGSTGSEASMDLSAQGVSEIVMGNISVLAGASHLTIASVKTVGSITYLTLRETANSIGSTIKLSTHLLGTASVVAGESVQVTTTASGFILSAAGKIIAFVPNELGKKLIFSQVI